MCEPTHSIVQFPNEDDRGPTGPRIDAIPQKDGWWSGIKKILKWLHISKLGFGHSEAMGAIPMSARLYLPSDTKYEANWWNRTVRMDGPFCGQEFDRDEAHGCAVEYANRVSIGNLTLVRQFLENSMKKSLRPLAYVERFAQDMLTGEGRDLFWKKMKSFVPKIANACWPLARTLGMEVEIAREKVIKIVLGFTRKRNILVPEWRDDDKLWLVT